MDKIVRSPDPDDPVEVNLRNPILAGILAWLIPGAGHLYQRRYAKGILFMVCILGTFIFGMVLGGGKVVYVSFANSEVRYSYIPQFFVGAPALPALIQRQRVIRNRPPLWNGFMAPPQQSGKPSERDELAKWHRQLKSRFDLGTLYTMVAGLLNILVIYDACAGPAFTTMVEEERKKKSWLDILWR